MHKTTKIENGCLNQESSKSNLQIHSNEELSRATYYWSPDCLTRTFHFFTSSMMQDLMRSTYLILYIYIYRLSTFNYQIIKALTGHLQLLSTSIRSLSKARKFGRYFRLA